MVPLLGHSTVHLTRLVRVVYQVKGELVDLHWPVLRLRSLN